MKFLVGRGSCGNAAGASQVSAVLEAGLPGYEVQSTGCIGMCYLEPIVDIVFDDGEKLTYVKVTTEAATQMAAIASRNPLQGIHDKKDFTPLHRFEIRPEDRDVLRCQQRIALKNCGVINPESIDDYMAKDGYAALKKCVTTMSPLQVIDEIKASELAGRGGAGFPTWFKWNAARNAPGEKKYIICNADEGDPGAFMDRAIIEGDPHGVIEGMMIGAYAIGADEGIIYVRAEYPLAITRLEIAIEQALGRGIFDMLGSGFVLRIKAGAGAFVCGEETALIASLEGERGMPRLRPPYPAEKGFWQQPSNINNVETFANVPWIIRNGGKAFGAMGTENSKGTKVFALTGKINKGGLVEVPMGDTINNVVYGVGGGVGGGKKFKAVQMGGPSGGCIPESLGETPIEYKALAATGAIMGSGGMVVMDDKSCMVDMARFFLDFTCKESCGKCTHCRVGTTRMLEILERICGGQGRDGDIALLEELAIAICDGSLCALGQTASNPVLTTIRYFRDEYESHINNKKCPARWCKPLLRYEIISEKCTGCTLCKRKCPSDAITGDVKKPHVIDLEKCTKCGVCKEVCRFDAVCVE